MAEDEQQGKDEAGAAQEAAAKEAGPAEAAKAEAAQEEASVLDALDLARGEVNDEDLEALEAAIHSIDFATRKASPERLERLVALHGRLGEVVEEIRSGRRRPQAELIAPTGEALERYQALIDQGVAAGERGDLDEAARHLEDAVRLHPEGLDGLFNLGVVYGLLAHRNIAKAEFYDDYTRDHVFLSKAQICYGRVLELDPEHLPSLNNLATLYSMRDNRDEAVPLLKRIVAIEPKGEDERQLVAEARAQLEELESI